MPYRKLEMRRKVAREGMRKHRAKLQAFANMGMNMKSLLTMLAHLREGKSMYVRPWEFRNQIILLPEPYPNDPPLNLLRRLNKYNKEFFEKQGKKWSLTFEELTEGYTPSNKVYKIECVEVDDK